jgi:hypothetical protein
LRQEGQPLGWNSALGAEGLPYDDQDDDEKRKLAHEALSAGYFAHNLDYIAVETVRTNA